MTQPEPRSWRARESGLRVGLSVLTPPSLALMAWGAWIVEAPWPVTSILLLLTAFLAYLVLFDFPTALEIDDDGLHRLSFLRRHTLSWEQVSGIVRLRKRGLIAVTHDHRRHVLIDRRLAPDELDSLRDQTETRGIRIEL